MKQATLKKEALIPGRGLHAGALSKIAIRPAMPGTGYKVTDNTGKKGGSFILSPFCVSDTKRGTTVKHRGFKLHTVEHMISALRGCGITNAELVVLEGNEPPIFDGSSLEMAALIKKAGIDPQKEMFPEISIDEPVLYKENGAYIAAIPADSFRVTYYSDFSAKGLAPQHADFHEADDYIRTVAYARTFGFKKEIEWLLKAGLIKGADMGSAVLFDDKGKAENTKLRAVNEPAMHKVLDVTGDLGLINARIKAHIIAYKTGHRHNVELAKILAKKHMIQEA